MPDFSKTDHDPRLRLKEWIEVGDAAAVAWGIPIVPHAVKMFYVPTDRTLSKALREFQKAEIIGEAACMIRTAPIRKPVGVFQSSHLWKRATLAICALELAQDSRGKEAMQNWTPPQNGSIEIERFW